ncbi:vWA domain-containing protein [Rhizohabitans arisaemae]|uniref:vWA domain-containing protein n=1 Tax=Rhizohabitans arisaemae TaxID=2720610 RepID=UPI0024B19110|nr:VWA domain-containing protein [Rhizohabitans arisaemae]
MLADVSGSMTQLRKIEILNECITMMIRSFTAERTIRGEIQVGVVAFGGESATLHQPPVPAIELQWSNLRASGRTPFGAALALLTELLADERVIPPNAFMPTLILISDGRPTDAWEGPLQWLLASPRGAKAIRLGVGIGQDMDDDDIQVLRVFIADPSIELQRADQAAALGGREPKRVVADGERDMEGPGCGETQGTRRGQGCPRHAAR